jgi:hemerythrin-like metal-binding protein
MVIWQEEYRLGNEVMDNIHEEFIALLNDALEAKGEAFEEAFKSLIEHTLDHFNYEEQQMEAVELGSRREHCDEHKRILSEMDFFYAKALNGRRSFARAYLKEQLPHWLRQHTATMDADLAAKLG